MSHPLAKRKPTKCNLCGNNTLYVLTVSVKVTEKHMREIKVGRCAACDTLPCISCNTRTMNPRQQRCKECDTPLLPKGA